MPATVTAQSTIYSPAVRALLPLLYVAWADRSLSRAELDLVKQKVSALPWLNKADQQLLFRLGDPRQPPTQEQFEEWGRMLHEGAASLDREDRESLAELGAEMAARADDASPFQAAPRRGPALSEAEWAKTQERDEAIAALRELESLLGPVDQRTIASVFPPASDGDDSAAGTPKYTFDVEAMKRVLDDKYPDFRDELRALLSSPAFAYSDAPDKESQREWTRQRVHDLAERGYGALALPKEYGGQDDFGRYSVVFEMLGYHDGSLAIKFGVQFGLWAGSVANLGTAAHHDRWLKAAGTGELQGCFAMTETGHGSNVRGLETTITYHSGADSLEVHTPHWGAGKEYIGNALDGEFATVFGQLIVDGVSQGVHAVVVPLRSGVFSSENAKLNTSQNAGKNGVSKDIESTAAGQLLPGITVEDSGYKMGLNGVDNGRIWFDHVTVPRENLLDKYGGIDADGKYHSSIENPDKRFFTMLGTLVGGRVCVPRAGLSAAKAGLAIAINYGLRRRQFAAGPMLPETLLLDYPSHQRRLLPVLAKAYALDAALDWLNARYAERTPDTMRELESQAAGLKAYATWYTTETLQVVREACGGKGYLLDNRIGQRKGDTEIYTTFEGDNTVLCYLVARSLLTKFQQSFNEDGAFGVLRFAASRVTSQFTDLNPVAVRNTDSEHLRSKDFLQAAFRFREERMVYSVAQRIRRKIKGGMSSGEAFVQIQTQLKDLALAYVERLTFDKFCESIAAQQDDELKEVQKLLSSLYGLHAIERDKGWFFEYEFLTPAKSKAIRREVEVLCAELRPHAAGLVDAFGIPREVLGARIV